MKAFDGYRAEPKKKGYPMLPAGAYVAVIKNVKVDRNALVLRLDISEGEYTQYYAKRYKHDSESSKYEPKYKGDFWLRIPGEQSMYPESDLKNFNDAMFCIQESNPGYVWDWNESGLIGKTVGVQVQAGNYNGSAFTKIKAFAVADDVRAGKVATLPPAEARGDAYEPPVDQQSGFQKVETSDLPF
jgi:hypothetical protein